MNNCQKFNIGSYAEFPSLKKDKVYVNKFENLNEMNQFYGKKKLT